MRYLLFFCCALALSAQQGAELTQALTTSRQRIDSIDDQIVKLLNERAQVVRSVGEIKQRFNVPASAPAREEQVLHRVAAQASAPLAPSAIESIYRTILREMSMMEQSEMGKGRKSP